MTLTGIALRNAYLRNGTRSFLTVAGTVIAALAFIFLRTVLSAWFAQSEASASDRVVTRNAISITSPLPLAYAEKVKQIPGVTKVTYSNWFQGVYKDPKNFFARFATEPESALDVFGIRFVQGKREDFLHERQGCIVGTELAKKYGFKLGDIIPIQGDIYPGDWAFKVVGIIEADDASISNTMYFQWAYLNEGLPDRRKNQIGIITTTVQNPNDSPKVIKAIDDLFANSDNETHTETEKSFRLSFLSGSSVVLDALQVVSVVILAIMALILGNTLAMGLRERTSELGAMRAIGFLPKHILSLTISEGTLLGLTGGLLGTLLAVPFLNGVGKIMSQMGFLSNLHFQPVTGVVSVLLAGFIGFLASLAPALAASKMDVVTALRRQE